MTEPIAPADRLDSIGWYVVHTKPRQEEVALLNLERQGYECYLPRMRVEKIRRGKAQTLSEPMFARYLFIRLDSSEQGRSWSPIRSTLGVNQLVRFGTRAARVDAGLIGWLREREAHTPSAPMFVAGEPVVIARGPLAGIAAIYQTADAEHRSMILLQFLNQTVSMRVDTGDLRKAG